MGLGGGRRPARQVSHIGANKKGCGGSQLGPLRRLLGTGGVRWQGQGPGEGGGCAWPPSLGPRQPQEKGRVSEEGRAENEHHPSPKGPAWDADGQMDRWTESQNGRLCICSPGPLKPRVSPGGGLGVAWSRGLGSQAPLRSTARPLLQGCCPPPRPARPCPRGSPAKLGVLVLGAPLCSPGPRQHTPSRAMGGRCAPAHSLGSLPGAGDPGSCSQAGQ